MKYFTEDYLNFFKELAANNNRDWFHANKKRYEQSVKEPFKAFIDDLILALQKIEPDITMTSKQAIFRIYRDIRFSKDKTPYKLHSSALIAPGNKKDKSGPPGIYVELGPESFKVYGGLYVLEKDKLYNVRTHIANNLDRFNKLINEKAFKTTFGGLNGEKNKIIPKEFRAAAEQQPLLYNKGFYYFHKMKPEEILKDNLVQRVIKDYKTGTPVKEFLKEGIGS